MGRRVLWFLSVVSLEVIHFFEKADDLKNCLAAGRRMERRIIRYKKII